MVALNVWPTDGADGSVATEAKWRKMGRLWARTGVAAKIGGELAPSLAGTNLTIADGACWVDGHFAELTGQQVLAVTANGIAVVRFDPAANSAELVYRDGVTVPARDPAGVYEMTIAELVGSALHDRRLFAGSQPACRMASPVAFGNMLPNVFTVIPWTMIHYDPLSMCNAPVGSITIPPGLGGVWHSDANISWQSATAGSVRYIDQFINGIVTTPLVSATQNQSGVIAMTTNFSSDIVLADGDVVTVRGYQNSGSGLKIAGYWALRRVGDTPPLLPLALAGHRDIEEFVPSEDQTIPWEA